MKTLNENEVGEVAAVLFDAAYKLNEYIGGDYIFALPPSTLGGCGEATINEIAKVIISIKNSAEFILLANNMG
jgi:hypothetical protein